MTSPAHEPEKSGRQSRIPSLAEYDFQPLSRHDKARVDSDARDQNGSSLSSQESTSEITLRPHPSISPLINTFSPSPHIERISNALRKEIGISCPNILVKGDHRTNHERKIYSALTKKMKRMNKDERLQVANYLSSLVELQREYSGSTQFSLSLRTTIPSSRNEAFPGEGFHLDVRGKRLLSTLVGPGMEWVLPEEVYSDKLNLIMNGKSCSQLLRQGAELKQVRETDVVLFEGNRVPHRPPKTDQLRLLCVIDSP